MNREILFRGKRVDNGEWVDGYLFDDGYQKPRHVFVGDLVIAEYNGMACDEWDIEGIGFYDVDPNTVCQYTGLTDKIGRKSLREILFRLDGIREQLCMKTDASQLSGTILSFSEKTWDIGRI